MDKESRLGGVASINLRIGDTALRVACGSRRGAKVLRSALADHLIDEDATLGFVIQTPHGRSRVYRLADRAGIVLATSRSLKPVLASLAHHLAAFLPPPPDCVRFRVNALASEQGLIACIPPLLFVPPPRRDLLLLTDYGLVDKLGVDVATSGEVHAASVPWPTLRDLALPPGHRSPPPTTSIVALAIPDKSPNLSKARGIVELANAATTGAPSSILSTAHRALLTAPAIGVSQQLVTDLPKAVHDCRSAQALAI